jgi:hypothetical protein
MAGPETMNEAAAEACFDVFAKTENTSTAWLYDAPAG